MLSTISRGDGPRCSAQAGNVQQPAWPRLVVGARTGANDVARMMADGSRGCRGFKHARAPAAAHKGDAASAWRAA
jgi:hypothetical protein